MLIFIDSNIFFGNWMLKSAYFQLLSKVSNIAEFQLLISEAVLLEIENKFNVEVERVKSDFSNLSAKIEEIWDLPSPLASFALPSSKYDFKKNVLDFFPDTIWIPIQDVDNSVLVHKAISSKMPFKSNEKGYRDAVIWQSLVQYLKANNIKGSVAFISENKHDFYDVNSKELQLHQDLLDDLNQMEINSEVVPYLSLKDFVGDKVYEHLQQDVDSVGEIFGNDIESQFQEHALSYINNYSIAELAEVFSKSGVYGKVFSLFKSFRYEFMEGVEDPDIHNLYTLSSTTLAFEYMFNIRGGIFEFTLNTSDYYSAQLDTNKDFINPNIDGLTTQVSVFGRLYFSASAVLDLETQTVEQITYDSVMVYPDY